LRLANQLVAIGLAAKELSHTQKPVLQLLMNKLAALLMDANGSAFVQGL